MFEVLNLKTKDQKRITNVMVSLEKWGDLYNKSILNDNKLDIKNIICYKYNFIDLKYKEILLKYYSKDLEIIKKSQSQLSKLWLLFDKTDTYWLELYLKECLKIKKELLKEIGLLEKAGLSYYKKHLQENYNYFNTYFNKVEKYYKNLHKK
jgi:hypothetical protein